MRTGKNEIVVMGDRDLVLEAVLKNSTMLLRLMAMLGEKDG